MIEKSNPRKISYRPYGGVSPSMMVLHLSNY